MLDDLVTVVYALEEPPPEWDVSVFLAGPTPRNDGVHSWRPSALAEIRRQWAARSGTGQRLVVFVPEPRDGAAWPSYEHQREWELRWGHRVDVVLFWIPRGEGMRGLTTNDEWGTWKASRRVVLGAPPEAQQVRYQRAFAAEHHIPASDTLSGTVTLALDHLFRPVRRRGGERSVPLHIWHTDTFQRWYTAQRGAGNELRDARQEWIYTVGPTRQHTMFWVLHVSIWVKREDRVKNNEVVLARPDVATVVAYHPADQLGDTEVVLVQEFRSTATTQDGMIHELPGGSSTTSATPLDVAVAELHEETGLNLAPGRFRAGSSRQVAGTLTIHHVHLFVVELTADELATVRADTRVHGVAADTERTVTEIWTVDELRNDSRIDWATLGAVTEALLPTHSVRNGQNEYHEVI